MLFACIYTCINLYFVYHPFTSKSLHLPVLNYIQKHQLYGFAPVCSDVKSKHEQWGGQQ